MPRSEEEIRDELKQKAAEAERVANMTPQERRKYDLQQKRKARVEADLEPERKMAEAMDAERKILASGQPANDDGTGFVMFERMRALVRNEEDDTQDYELMVTATEVTLRGLKNQEARVADEDRMVLVYGRNLTEPGLQILKELLKLCRTQVAARKVLKRRQDMTEEEVDALQKQFFNECLPDGWYFDGSIY